MAKTAKITLTDEENNKEDYKFQTLSMRQASAIEIIQREIDTKPERIQKLHKKEETEEGVSFEEMGEILDFQREHNKKSTDNMIEAIRISLSKNHDEFKVSEVVPNDEQAKASREQEIADVNDKIQSIMDLEEVMSIGRFVISGVLQQVKQIDYDNEEIDLTE